MTVRFVHSADLHLDAPLRSLSRLDPALRERVATASREALGRIVARCVETGAEALLLAGDVFDGSAPTIEAAAHFAARVAELDRAGVRVFMIRGNHDFGNLAFERYAMPPNLEVFGPQGGTVEWEARDGTRVAVHGLSYESRTAPAAALDRYPAPRAGALNVGLLHTSLAEAGAHERYAPCSPEELAAVGYDYWALGHVHQRAVHRTQPWIVMPGCPQGRHANEPGSRSATEVLVEGGRVVSAEPFDTSVASFERIEVPLEAGLDPVEACRRAVGAGGEPRAEGVRIARLRLAGPGEALRAARRDLDWIERRLAEELAEDDALWIERVEVAEEKAATAGGDAPGAAGEISAKMASLATEPGVRTALLEVLEEGRALLPPEARRRLMEDEAATRRLLDALIPQAVGEVAAALEGEGEA